MRANLIFLPICVGWALSNERPNILLCISDDQSWRHTSANGDPVVKTPAFDRIAREGIRFTNAFCDAPSCGPSRSALLTGQAIWRLEEGGNLHSSLPAKFITYPELLEQAGYRIGYTGKGWAPGKLEPGNRKSNPAGHPYRERKAEPPAKAISWMDYAGNFEDFLNESDSSQPFCFWLGTGEPHRAYEAGSGKKRGKEPGDVHVPAFLPDHPTVRSDLLDYFVEIEHFDNMVHRALTLLEKAGQLENTLVIVTSDHGMPFPRAKASLYDSGTRVPLAIRWPKGILQPGRVSDEFINLSDLAPTILEAASVEVPKMMTASGMESIFQKTQSQKRSAAFTAMERHAGCRQGGKGYPCRAIRTKDFLYIFNFAPERWPAGSPDPTICVRAIPFGEVDPSPTKTFMMANRTKPIANHLASLAFDKRPQEELYEISTDPFQLTNLAGKDQYQKIQKKLKTRLFQHLKNTKDPRGTGSTALWDYYPFYRKSQSPGWKIDPIPTTKE